MPSSYTIRAAARDEEKAVLNVIYTAFGLDTAWGDSFKLVRGYIDSQLTSSFLHRAVPCLVVTHGTRVIAASALNTNDDAPCHLISGPCVLNEYRNRGLGTALLHESLAHLKTAGLQRACAVCKENVPGVQICLHEIWVDEHGVRFRHVGVVDLGGWDAGRLMAGWNFMADDPAGNDELDWASARARPDFASISGIFLSSHHA